MKKQKILVSILIINFNNAKLLDRAINSCINQKYTNTEILIFDDKSTDNSKYVLSKYKDNKKIKIFYNNKLKKKFAALNAMNGYVTLFQKSKGSILFLLDSDDYFHKNKIYEINKIFQKKKNVDFVQDMPFIKEKNSIKIKKNKNNSLSFWPYLAPESCISFRRKFMIKFLKINKIHSSSFNNIWLGFRMGVYAYFNLKNFYSINKNLTYYESLGQSKQYEFLNRNWINRRMNSFKYLKRITKNKIKLNRNLDYLITNFMSKLY